MYYNEHNPPHFHANYNGIEAQFDLIEGAFVQGALPSKQSRLVLAWYEIHIDELMQNWNDLKTGKGYCKIDPLV